MASCNRKPASGGGGEDEEDKKGCSEIGGEVEADFVASWAQLCPHSRHNSPSLDHGLAPKVPPVLQVVCLSLYARHIEGHDARHNKPNMAGRGLFGDD